MKPVLLFKSHIDTYTKKDGTVVAAHDDKRTAATPTALAHAKRVVEAEDHMPWAEVRAAKKLLGIAEPDHVAEVKAELAAKAPKKHKIDVIQGTMEEAGGYSVNGKRYVGDDHEGLVDEAKEMAHRTGRKVEDVIHHIMPQEHLDAADAEHEDKPLTKAILFLKARS